jgi:hypothetical protein
MSKTGAVDNGKDTTRNGGSSNDKLAPTQCSQAINDKDIGRGSTKWLLLVLIVLAPYCVGLLFSIIYDVEENSSIGRSIGSVLDKILFSVISMRTSTTINDVRQTSTNRRRTSTNDNNRADEDQETKEYTTVINKDFEATKTNPCFAKFYDIFLNTREQKALLKEASDLKSTLETLSYHKITIPLHRNGESESCHDDPITLADIILEFYAAISYDLDDEKRGGKCPVGSIFENKYNFEAFLTEIFHNKLNNTEALTNGEGCTSEDSNHFSEGFYGFCDMGPNATPELSDHHHLVANVVERTKVEYLPCHFHSANGVRIVSFSKLMDVARQHLKASTSTTVLSDRSEECTIDLSRTSHANTKVESNASCIAQAAVPPSTSMVLFAVPAGRLFLHTPFYIGQSIALPHVNGVTDKPIYLKVLSIEPKVFEIFNFFSQLENEDIIDRILKETKDSHRIKRSSTGAKGYTLNSRRTSETGFDTDGATAMKLKR